MSGCLRLCCNCEYFSSEFYSGTTVIGLYHISIEPSYMYAVVTFFSLHNI